MKILKRIKRFFRIASPSEEMQKEGEYHAVMLARIFSKIAATLNEYDDYIAALENDEAIDEAIREIREDRGAI